MNKDYFGYGGTGIDDLANPPAFINVQGPGGGGDTSGGGVDLGGGVDSGGRDPSQVIHNLGYDPADPRNDLTRGFGSGVPTQRIIGGIASFLGNAAFPGLGALTGAVAAKITQMIQNGASKSAVQAAIAKYQVGGSGGDDGGGSGGGGGGGSGNNQGYSSPDYLRSIGYGPGQGRGSLWPGGTGNWGYNQDNPGSASYAPSGPFAGSMALGGIGEGGGSFFHQNPGGRGGPLPGAGGDYGGAGGNLGIAANQQFRGIWDTKNPLSPGGYAGMQGFFNYNNTPFGGGSAGKFNQGMNYSDYVQQWNALRQAGATGPGTGFTPGPNTSNLAGGGKPLTKTQ